MGHRSFLGVFTNILYNAAPAQGPKISNSKLQTNQKVKSQISKKF